MDREAVYHVHAGQWIHACPHDSETGDEGPAVLLRRPVVRWRCDGCGRVRTDDNAEQVYADALRTRSRQLLDEDAGW